MGKPVTAPYPWDTNGTNVQVPTSSHETDGFVIGEVPTSTEVNGLWANWYAVLAWIYANHGTTRYRWQLPVSVSMTGSYTAGMLQCARGEGALGISIEPAVGEVIDAIGVTFATNSGTYGGAIVQVLLQRATTNPSGGNAVVTTIATLNAGFSFGFDQAFRATQAVTGGNGPGGTTEIVQDGAAYYYDLTVTWTGSAGPVNVTGVGYEVLDAW